MIFQDPISFTVAGFWLGYDVNKYKLNIGNAINYLKWTGTKLELAGDILAGIIDGAEIRVGGPGSNQEIYFKDSELYLYDAGNRYINIYKLGYKTLQFALGSTISGITSAGILSLNSLGKTQIQVGSNYFYFWSGGTFQLVNLETAPTAHPGDLTYHIDEGNDPYFHGYIGAPDNTWGKFALTTPNW